MNKTNIFLFLVGTSLFNFLNANNASTITLASSPEKSKDESTPLSLYIVSFLFYVIVLVIGLIGNLLVLIVFGSRCRELKTCERYLVNLAVADLIGSLVVPVDKLYYLVGGHYDVIGTVGCVCVGFVTITTFTVSSLTLIAISIDRCVVVKWPLHPRITANYTLCVFLSVWIIGSLPGIPYFINNHVHLELVEGTDRMVCGHNMSSEMHIIHTMITFSMQVALPLVIMTSTYVLIIRELVKIEKSDLFRDQQVDTFKRFTQNKKTIKLLVVVVTLFFVCVAPVNVFYLLYLFNLHGMSAYTATLLFNILLMLQMLNSCINPVVYSKLHTSFRRESLKILCACCLHKFQIFQTETMRRMSYASSRLSRFSKDFSAANERFIRRISRSHTVSTLNNVRRSTIGDGVKIRRDTTFSLVELPDSTPDSHSLFYRYKQALLMNDIIRENEVNEQMSFLSEPTFILSETRETRL